MAAKEGRPGISLEFEAEMHISNGFGHSGDGCIAAELALRQAPVVSQVWFDAPGQRLAQKNVGLAHVDPRPNTTFIGRYDLSPPTEIVVTLTDHNRNHHNHNNNDDVNNNQKSDNYYNNNGNYYNNNITQRPSSSVYASVASSCTTQPFSPVICRNGSRACPPTFGHWGELNGPFSSVLGMFYENTTLLKRTAHSQIWQWEWTNPTLMPNGTYINVTRNYTYTLGREPDKDGRVALHRFQWTQSIPLQPALPVHRDCFIFDYTTSYKRGPLPASHFEAPHGVKCVPGTQREKDAKILKK